jgi:hypothetical protein
MRQAAQIRSRRTASHRAVLVGAALACTAVLACEFDEGDWQLDQGSGATSPRGGSGSSAGGPSRGGSSSQAGEGGEPARGGSGAVAQPKVHSMEPTSGPYGTAVTITGAGFGSSSLARLKLGAGDRGEVELGPDSEGTVISWSDEEIVFRYPFPAEGAVSVESPGGAAAAGEFQPTWRVAQVLDKAPAASVLASISTSPGRIQLLFDTMPLTLLDVGPDGVSERSLNAPDLVPASARLYSNAQGKVEGVGISDAAEPVIVHLRNQDDDLIAEDTTIELEATELSVAGGSAGASVWMRRATGWFRARPTASSWMVDKGPIADANANAPDRASGNTSDGSLFVAWSEDASFLTDDMEAPYMAKLAPTASKFAGEKAAGGSVDDYVSSLTLTSRGDGLVVRVCGSDVDPFGLSGTDRYCYDSLHAPSGAHLFHVPVKAKAILHAFTHERAVAAYCSADDTWLIRTDADVESAPGAPIGEEVLFPCPEAVALEVSGEGDYLPVVRLDGQTYLLERNPAASP